MVLTTLSSSLAVRYPSVNTTLLSDDLAELSILCEITNFGAKDVDGLLFASIDGGTSINQTVHRQDHRNETDKIERKKTCAPVAYVFRVFTPRSLCLACCPNPTPSRSLCVLVSQ